MLAGALDWVLTLQQEDAARETTEEGKKRAQRRFADAVLAAKERYGAARVAVVLGTSTSGVQASEDAFRGRDAEGKLPPGFDYEHTQDLFSVGRYVRDALGLRGPALVVSTACASSAKSFIDAHHLIESGLCDAAVVGGVDSLCRMTLRGFASLELISDEPCRPCDADRRGISIGEAAGFALLERADRAPGGPEGGRVALLGYGASSDGYHMSAPHPRGAGAVGAMRAALETTLGRAGFAVPEPLLNQLVRIKAAAIGFLSDRTRSRWGRRHPWMYGSAAPIMIGYVLLWNPPAARSEEHTSELQSRT